MAKKRQYTFIDLFAGCGGLSEGFMESGHFKGLAHIEWEYPMVQTLRNRLVKKWNETCEQAQKKVILFDIQRTDELLFGNWTQESIKQYAKYNSVETQKGLKHMLNGKTVDLIIGGPPCQAYSIHGRATDKNSMQNDYRNYLFESFVKVVDEIKPKAFIFENVTGMLSAKPGGKPVVERIYKAVTDIGYLILSPDKFKEAVYNAYDYSVPQNRERVILCGIKIDSGFSIEEFYKTLSKNKSLKHYTVNDAIGNLPPIFPLDKIEKVKGKNVSHYATDDSDKFHMPRHCSSRDIRVFREWIANDMNKCSQKEAIDFYEKVTGKKTLYRKYRNLEWDKPSPTVVAHLQKDFFIKDLHLTIENNSEDYFGVYKSNLGKYYLYFIPRPLYENFIKMFVSFAPNVSVQASTDRPNRKNGILQQIFYGAPGTGKSHTIEEETKEEDVIRITFHPDTDYSTFVGAYKPTTALLPICDELGQPMKIGTTTLHKEQIVYEFVAQSFLQAYVNAWEKYDKGDKQYLVIEEINRGNCAQIFGDLFQLLDRNDYGFSDYPIKADADMKRQLQKAFAGLVIAQKDKINTMYEGKDIVSQVLNGDILLLPNNLYIWATMNTSDQSLFPIDSAFKRRWDWTYMPISNAEKDWIIEVDGSKYDWWQFLERINEKIGSTTNSEDKKLGYFFCKAQDGVISAKTFVGKVIFYLWNDVFKDYEFGDAIFNDEDGSKLSFGKFYT